MSGPLRVVDTSVWIEWLIGSPLGKKLKEVFPDKPNCVVPTIVQLELAKWSTRELGEERADQVIPCARGFGYGAKMIDAFGQKRHSTPLFCRVVFEP
jgi:hypothetical protein